MIKSNEVRIGNWVKDSASVPFQIEPSDIVALKQMEVAGKDSIHYSPIPLTEEWILKLGFMLWKDGVYKIHWGRNGIEFIMKYPDKLWYYETGNNSSKHIEYVHQLQNIHFALTERELGSSQE